MDSTGIYARPNFEGKTLHAEFHSVWTTLVEDILSEVDDDEDENGAVRAQVLRLLNGTVPQGKQNRGLSLVGFNMHFDPQQSKQKKALSLVLGWCLEILQASFLVADDIMDDSETRRGQPCWYRLKDVGRQAISDAFILENAVYILLTKYFATEQYFEPLLTVFNDITYKTTLGQSLDIRSSVLMNCTEFSPEHYSSIVKYKTSYYSFCMPMKCALIMNGIEDAEASKVIENILIDMGHFFQVQDDYLDCFGDTKITGKVGTDIADGKCSWLIVQALQLASAEQKVVLQECYGTGCGDEIKLSSMERDEQVKNVYNRLGLERIFATYEEETFDLISRQILSLPSRIPAKPFSLLLNQIYKRVK